MIVFKTIKWRNFLSTGDAFTEVNLNTHDTTLIVGDNGAGKSTILDALSFALYGKPFRKINKPQLINSINKKNLQVELEFSIGKKEYLIKRGIKPNVFEVYYNGELLNLDASVGDYQEMLDKHILKINHKSFSQIVVLGSASFVPFMQLSAAARREVIEDLLDIGIFSTMNTFLKERVQVNKDNIQDNAYKIELTQNKLEMEHSHLGQLETNKEAQIQEKKSKLLSIKTVVEGLQASIAELQAEYAKYDYIDANTKDLTGVLQERQLELQSINRNKLQHRREVDFLCDNENCPTCKQVIDDKFRDDVMQSKVVTIAELEGQELSVQQEINKINQQLEALNKDSIVRDQYKTQLDTAKTDFKTQMILAKSIKHDLDRLKATDTHQDNTNRIEALNVEYGEHLQRRNELLIERSVLDAGSVMLKDTGIKTRIIKQYMPVINKLINKYLAAMDFFVNFEIDENFNETIKSRFRDDFSYASFSEGEKSRLDLALLFTWRSISRLRNSTNTNLLILDEVFDGSLDNQGNEELLKIIGTLTEGSNVFVISHKTDAYLDKFNRVLRFEKVKNFSRMKEL